MLEDFSNVVGSDNVVHVILIFSEMFSYVIDIINS